MGYQYEIRTIFDLLVQYHILTVEFKHLNSISHISKMKKRQIYNLSIEKPLNRIKLIIFYFIKNCFIYFHTLYNTHINIISIYKGFLIFKATIY